MKLDFSCILGGEGAGAAGTRNYARDMRACSICAKDNQCSDVEVLVICGTCGGEGNNVEWLIIHSSNRCKMIMKCVHIIISYHKVASQQFC